MRLSGLGVGSRYWVNSKPDPWQIFNVLLSSRQLTFANTLHNLKVCKHEQRAGALRAFYIISDTYFKEAVKVQEKCFSGDLVYFGLWRKDIKDRSSLVVIRKHSVFSAVSPAVDVLDLGDLSLCSVADCTKGKAGLGKFCRGTRLVNVHFFSLQAEMGQKRAVVLFNKKL